MKHIRDFFKVLRIHFSSFIIFELIHKLLMALVLLPLGYKIFNMTLKLMDINYITNDTFNRFMSSPYLIMLILLLLVIYIFFSMFEVFGIVECFDINNQSNLKKIFCDVFKDFKRLLYFKNIGYMLILIFYIPLLQLSFGALVYFLFLAPQFIIQNLNYNTIIIRLVILMLTNLIVMSPFMYIIHYFVIGDLPFSKAIRQSIKKTNGNKIKMIVIILLLESMLTVMFISILALIILGSYIIVKIFSFNTSILTYVLIVIRGFIHGYMVVFTCLQVPLLLSFISFYFYKGQYLEIIKTNKIKRNKFSKQIINIVIVFLISIAGTYFIENFIADLDISFSNSRQIEVMAHRGSSLNAPENTMAAFELAIEQNSDYIELDIQQSKDGEIVVLHDPNLKRITGVDLNVYDATYKELLEYDIGSHFDAKFSDQRVLNLEDVLKAVKGKIRLNIEIKPTGYEHDLEKQLVQILKTYRFEQDCIITSMDYDVLKKIKSYNPELKTGYVLNVAFGEFYKMEDVDCFSIQQGYINENVVAKVHEHDKKIYAWTVNSHNDIVKMINLGVDGIITDQPELAHELIYSCNYFPTIISLLDFLFK